MKDICKHLKPETVAKMLNVNVTTIYRWKRGARKPSKSNEIRIQLLKNSVMELVQICSEQHWIIDWNKIKTSSDLYNLVDFGNKMKLVDIETKYTGIEEKVWRYGTAIFLAVLGVALVVSLCL